MLNTEKLKRILIMETSGFSMSSAAVFCIPFIDLLPGLACAVFKIIAAILFWLGTALWCAVVIYSKPVLNLSQNEASRRQARELKGPPGIFRFSVKKSRVIIYLLIISGIAVIISDMVFNLISEFIMFPILSISFFLFAVHCVIDGKVFNIYKLTKEGTNDD